MPAPGEDRFSYMAFGYVGDTDEEALRIGQKIAWFLTVSIKSAPQFAKFLPGKIVPEMAPAAWRAGASRRPRPTNLDVERLIGQGQMFAGNPDTVARQIKEFRKRVGGVRHVIMMTRQGLVTHAEAEKSFTLAAKEVLPQLQDLPPVDADETAWIAERNGREMIAVPDRPPPPEGQFAQRTSWLLRYDGLFDLEILRRGSGRPILLIHGINPVSPKAPFLDLLAAHGEVIAPSHPGFGDSPLPADFDTMYDLVNLYLAVLDALPRTAVGDRIFVRRLDRGGTRGGGHPKLGRLVLVDPVGIKLGGREERDIVHFFNTDPAELNRRAWHDPAHRPAGIYGLGWQATISDAMTDEEMITLARNWDSLCLYAWRPHMYNPQLSNWLHRIAVPTQVIWGASDGIVTPDYGQRYAELIPGAKFALIADGRPSSRTGAAASLCRPHRPVSGAITNDVHYPQ